MFDGSFHFLLITACLEDIHTSCGCLKKIKLEPLGGKCFNKILSYTFHTAHEKEAITPKFSKGNMLQKKSHITVKDK